MALAFETSNSSSWLDTKKEKCKTKTELICSADCKKTNCNKCDKTRYSLDGNN